MAQLVRQYKTDMKIRELALSIVAGLPSRCWSCEVKAIQRYILNHIRYTRDVLNVETLATPIKTLEYRQGDCDDVSVLAATLLQSIGHPVRFLAVGFNGKPLSHVLIETLIGDKWYPVELTVDIPPGQLPHAVTTKYIVNIK